MPKALQRAEASECAAELCATPEQLRAIVDHAPEAIAVFDCYRGRFVLCNESAGKLFGLTREQLLQTDVIAISLEFQADGQPSPQLVREQIAQALAGQTPTFEWLFRHADGRVIPCEVRLVRLPGESQQLIRGSIIDLRERRHRAQVQRATYEISEAVHQVEDLDRLYERIHSIVRTLMPADNFYIVLHDPAAGHHYYAYHVDLVDARPAPRVMTEGLNGYVLRTGKSLLVNRASMTDPKSPWRLRAGTPSAVWLGVPLEVRGTALGLMAVQDYNNEHAYGEEEKQLLTYVAKQIALAIDRKRAEEALKQRHREVMTLLDSLPGYAFLKDVQGRYIMANQNFCRALGQTSDTIVGKTDHDLFPTEMAAKYRADDAKLLVSGEPLQVGEEQMLQAGQLLFVETTKVPVKNECDEVVGLIGLGFDVTERRRAEEELRRIAANLRESEARFRSAFYSSPIRTSIARVSDGRFIEVNDAFLEGLGLPRAEVIGKNSTELDIWTNSADRDAFWEDLKRSGVIRQREVTVHNRRGRLYTMLLSADIVEIRGEPHVLVNALDITERKQAEQELLRTLAREKELGDLKSSFVSMVSHEFRTPLGIIMSSAEILQDYLEDLSPDERREHLQSIHKNTRRMAELMEEVLLLSRFDAGKMAFQPKLIDLRSFCRRVADEVLTTAECRNPITLHCEVLPAEAHADERLLHHILLNVLTNALKYSDCGQPIDFSIRPEGRDAVCRIVDRGIGIPEADREWLFNAFHRGRNVGQRPGTGLGLVIVKRCVDLHAGRIQIESKLGEGTAVIIRLPVFTNP